MREYDEIAEWFTAARNPDIGVPDIATLAQTLPPRARVLDVGCGDGVPVSRLLLREGFDLAALDSSPEMVKRYRANFPDVSTRCVRVQDARFAPRSFEAVVAWGVLFHLAAAEQAAAIERVSEWVKPGGRFLFTSGDVEEVAESEMNGVAFRYVSLGVGVYRSLLEGGGMRLEHHHADAWGNYVYVAAKAAEPATAGRQRVGELELQAHRPAREDSAELGHQPGRRRVLAETVYLSSMPEVAASIREGLETPLEGCIEELDW